MNNPISGAQTQSRIASRIAASHPFLGEDFAVELSPFHREFDTQLLFSYRIFFAFAPDDLDVSQRIQDYHDINQLPNERIYSKSESLTARFLNLMSEISTAHLGIERDYASDSLTTTQIEGSSPAHDEAVRFVIHSALDHAYQQYQSLNKPFSLYHVLSLASSFLTDLRRYDEYTSQNLVLRDAEHYLVSRTANWRSFIPRNPILFMTYYAVYGAPTPFGQPPSLLESILSIPAALYWDYLKSQNPEEAQTTRLPASPVGGSRWSIRGSLDYIQLDLPLLNLALIDQQIRPHDPSE